jgi:hypothetical protein
MMPLKHILKNKILLQKNFNLQEYSIDLWPYWTFEENIKIANEIIEEEENNRKSEEESQNKQMGNMDPNSIMRNMSNITNSLPKY